MSEIIGSIKIGNQTGKLPQDGEDISKTSTSSLIHPIVKVNIRLHKDDGELIEDSLFWDWTCDLNSPEKFAQDYWEDLQLSKIHEKQVAFAIRKQVFDHLKQISLMKKYNFLKNLGIPVNKEMIKSTSKGVNRNNEMNDGERSEFSDNDIYIPQ